MYANRNIFPIILNYNEYVFLRPWYYSFYIKSKPHFIITDGNKIAINEISIRTAWASRPTH